MYHIILAFAILLTSVVSGQPVTMHGLPVDTIIVKSSSGGYHFDKKGTNSGQSDFYTITFDKTTGNYIVSEHKSVFLKETTEPYTHEESTKHLHKYTGKVVNRNKLDSLTSAFSSPMNNPSFEDLGISKDLFFSLTDEKHIRKVAKLYGEDWHFRMRYSTKEKKEAILDGCQNIDTFNLFLSTKFQLNEVSLGVTDSWDLTSVEIVTASKTFLFEGIHPNPFKQPWLDFTKTGEIHPTSILNLKINGFLVEILPGTFFNIKTLQLQTLTDEYIRWYLKRRDILFY